jgi:hypothetical protein
METQLHILLLENLRNAGIGVTVDISPFIVSHFKKPNKSDFEYDKGMRPALLFIEDLVKRKFISSDEDFDLLTYFNVINNPKNNTVKWFDDIDINMYLTSNGLDYLDSHYLQQSYFSLNGASERNYRSQKWFSIATITLAIVTTVMAILTFSNTSVNNIKIYLFQKSIDSLKQEVIRLPHPTQVSQEKGNHKRISP